MKGVFTTSKTSLCSSAADWRRFSVKEDAELRRHERTDTLHDDLQLMDVNWNDVKICC